MSSSVILRRQIHDYARIARFLIVICQKNLSLINATDFKIKNNIFQKFWGPGQTAVSPIEPSGHFGLHSHVVRKIFYIFSLRMECCDDAVKINYEVRKRSKSKVQNYEIVEAVKEYLTYNPTSHAVPSFFKDAVGLNPSAIEFLRQNVSEINICEGNGL